jgi:RimJ/RimL family protein N-acetyltransferase
MHDKTTPEILTSRLKLRAWKASDRQPFAAMNADRNVMEYFPKRLTRVESDELVKFIERHFRERGYGLWAVEVIDGAPFVGFVGLNYVTFDAPFTPATEIGWRLGHEFWGKGYASEAGLASLNFAFQELKLPEVISFTTATNLPSQRVMQRIGMDRDTKEDFNHPALPEGHPLRRHVLYRLAAHAADRTV